MTKKSLDYWQKQWDMREMSDDEFANIPTHKLLLLLQEYAAIYNTSSFQSKISILFNEIYAYFTKGYYSAQITTAVGNYFHASGVMYWNKSYHHVEVVFALIKEQLQHTMINENDDLFWIIRIAEKNTNIVYKDIVYKDVLYKRERDDYIRRHELYGRKYDGNYYQNLERLKRFWKHHDILAELQKLYEQLSSTAIPQDNSFTQDQLSVLTKFQENYLQKLKPILFVITEIKFTHGGVLKKSANLRTLINKIEKVETISTPFYKLQNNYDLNFFFNQTIIEKEQTKDEQLRNFNL